MVLLVTPDDASQCVDCKPMLTSTRANYFAGSRVQSVDSIFRDSRSVRLLTKDSLRFDQR